MTIEQVREEIQKLLIDSNYHGCIVIIDAQVDDGKVHTEAHCAFFINPDDPQIQNIMLPVLDAIRCENNYLNERISSQITEIEDMITFETGVNVETEKLRL